MAGSDVLTGTFAGRYTIERELGSGATATVYLARDTQRGISVAVKLLRLELSQSVGADRFLREIRLNEKLHHPHIVPVLDSGEHDGRLYFVLPHMEEGSLRQLLQREKQLPIERAIAITKTIAQALDYAHQQNIIHRDVKPENILFTSGQACLADFGIARAVERAIDESTTDTGLVRGTPAYMSPEQASGSKQYDGRSDQYSLACVLYEMLAGVPAFIGPTPEAVIAQRFQHAPRELRVYRPTISPDLARVIDKALALTPADRFGGAAEFHDALVSASRAYPAPQQPIARRRLAWSSQFTIGAVAVAAIAMTAVLGGDAARAVLGSDADGLDPARVVLLPVEGSGGAPAEQVYRGLTRSFSRWSDLRLVSEVEVQDQLTARTGTLDDRESARLARRLGAARYVRSRVTGSGAELTLTAVLSDAVAGTSSTTTVSFPSSDGASVYDGVVGQLLFGSTDAATWGTRSTRAARGYLDAVQAREAFNLSRADSLLLVALEADPRFARAALALAQVRVWKEEPARTWQSWAELAATDSSLGATDRRLANGLRLMGSGNYPAACEEFRRLVSGAPRAFDHWYGLASCLRRDKVVVPDPSSPSGFRFRTSYQQAIHAYVQAFQLAPVMHRSFQPGAYAQLRRILFADHILLREGTSIADGPTEFYAAPLWRGDSLLFVPYPTTVHPASARDAASRRMAVSRQQQLFARVAQGWAAALPNNPSTKEAVAISLEMLGDPSALDTLRAARIIAHDADQLVRLAAEEVLMRVSFGRADPRQLALAAALGDSLLAVRRGYSRAAARTLAPVAAVLGRCREAGRLASAAVEPRIADALGVAPSVLASAESLNVIAGVGCDRVIDTLTVAAVEATFSRRTHSERDKFLRTFQLLALGLRQGAFVDSARLATYASATRDDVLVMRVLLRTAPDSVRARLRARAEALGSDGTINRAPDAVQAEARLWLAVGDTASAMRWLDPALNESSWFQHMIDRPIAAGSLMRSAALRAHLAGQVDPSTARRWRAFVDALWSRADADLRFNSPAVPSASH